MGCLHSSDENTSSCLRKKKRTSGNSGSGPNNEEGENTNVSVETTVGNEGDVEINEEIQQGDAAAGEVVQANVVNEGDDGISREEQRVIEQLTVRRFTFAELSVATGKFRYVNLLGEGGFGRVYRGKLQDTDQIVAVKRMIPRDKHTKEEFLVEAQTLGSLDHPNLVNLVGFCAERHERLLVYEFMPLGSLDDHLHGEHPDKRELDWKMRLRIATEAAIGLAYLHAEPIIYRDLKTANILLDQDLHVKLSDFGMAKVGPVGEQTYVLDKSLMGTYGYCPPEYAMTGQLSLKSDIFSFGVVLLELITGRRAIDFTQEEQNLSVWALDLLKDERNVPQMGDPALAGQYTQKALRDAITISASCISSDADLRPSANAVVIALDNLIASQSNDPSDRAECSGVKDVDEGEG